MKWDFRKYFGGFHDSCIGRGSVNFDSSASVGGLSATEMSSHASCLLGHVGHDQRNQLL